MIIHPSTSVLFVVQENNSSLNSFLTYLEPLPHIELTVLQRLPQDLNLFDVIVTSNTSAFTDNPNPMADFVKAGGGWIGLTDLSEEPIPDLFGAQPSPIGPTCELRVMFKNEDHPLAVRLSDAVYLKGKYQCLDKLKDDTEIVLCADWHYAHSPMLVTRPVAKGNAACTTFQAYDDPGLQRVLYRLLRHLGGNPMDKNNSLGVGLLGYSQFVGQEHGLGVSKTHGLDLRAVCDVLPARLDQAAKDFPDLRPHESADTLANDDDVDLVIISTPPNTHARLSLKMMASGKHVLCEKPLAINRKETDAMVEMAEKQRVHLSCHQNRRWDTDYLAIKQAVDGGLVGDLFYIETFVGGFNHPCGYWHSHDEISGGTAYDWGGHYLDWIVSLIPERVQTVIGTRHKRVWHDVTNADQERIQIRFEGGQEAEFLHSDIAAVRKPKWYLLGTEGAIIGQWRDVTTYEIDPVVFYHQRDIPPTEMAPDLSLHRRAFSGQIEIQKLPVPRREIHPLYRNLADHLHLGEPIVAPLEHSVAVVAILEAAARSAAKGGTLERLDG